VEEKHLLQNGQESHIAEFLPAAKATDFFPPTKQLLGARKFVRYPIDSDGLISHDNKMQQRVVEIISGYQTEMLSLRRDLYATRQALSRQQGCHTSGGHLLQGEKETLESLMVPFGGSNGQADYEDSSGVQTGSTASDVSSWEAVDEREAKQTLWVPDHALAACMRYESAFMRLCLSVSAVLVDESAKNL
jgi:hypothetical protein